MELSTSLQSKQRKDEQTYRKEANDSKEKKKAAEALLKFEKYHKSNTLRVTEELEKRTGLESRLTILGHYQRGGTPSAADRLLATRLGSACIEYIDQGLSGVMVAVDGNKTKAVPLEQVVGRENLVPPDHPWVKSARDVSTCFGD